jgi:hypothetical protein
MNQSPSVSLVGMSLILLKNQRPSVSTVYEIDSPIQTC